ncbi:hypothetical protein ABID21_004424 [Pseudorhizobium tarimense]|uniref:Uncharacterized protein n=1 Tax=Pseudorhizobium tarimense TaxID=1079109 RepID=A0ABV2HCQ0_9HYPH
MTYFSKFYATLERASQERAPYNRRSIRQKISEASTSL